MKILIVYGTTRGYTAKIAERIAQIFREDGDATDIVEGRSVPADLALSDYAGVVVGASVIAGRFQPYIADFVRGHADALARLPSAFFSVSLTEADPDPQRHARAMHTITRFLEETGWRPDTVASFAGSIAYLRYRWIMRLIWRRLPLPATRAPGRTGIPTDDGYAYTDWAAVSRFAGAFIAATRAARRVIAPV